MTPSDRLATALDLILQRAAIVAKLTPQLVTIIDTDARNSSTRDGYPGGGEPGPRGNSELTPTEAAATGRMARRMPDEYHRAAMGLLDGVERILRDLGNVIATPDRIANLQKLDDELERGNDSWCWIAQQAGMPYDEAWTKGVHRSTVGGFLSEPRTVCRWSYDFVKLHAVMPTKKQCEDHLTRDTYRIHVDPKVTKRMERGTDTESVRAMRQRWDGAA